MPRLSPKDIETLLYSSSLPFAKNLQGEIALNTVNKDRKTELRSFGGVVLKTIPLSLLTRFDKDVLPDEYLDRMSHDTHFHRLHFLPMGDKSAQSPAEMLKILLLGTLDLINLANWFHIESNQSPDQLKHRYLIGISGYDLGNTIKKHLPVFEILAESPPLDDRDPLQRSLKFLETTSAHFQLESSFVALGSFVPEFLMHAQKLPYYRQRLFSLITRRYPEFRDLTIEKLEYELRRQAIFKASGITR